MANGYNDEESIDITERIVYFKEKRGDKKVMSLCDIVNRDVT